MVGICCMWMLQNERKLTSCFVTFQWSHLRSMNGRSRHSKLRPNRKRPVSFFGSTLLVSLRCIQVTFNIKLLRPKNLQKVRPNQCLDRTLSSEVHVLWPLCRTIPQLHCLGFSG